MAEKETVTFGVWT